MMHEVRNIDVKEFLKYLIVPKKMSNAYPMQEGEFGNVWNARVQSSEDMERNFITTMNRQRLCPDFELYHVTGPRKLRRNHFQNPTIALRKETMKRNAGNLPFETIHYPVNDFEWKSSELVIQFSTDRTDDLYPVDEEQKEIAAALAAQLVTYWREHSEKQHRTHLYQVLIFGPNVRLVKFARDGLTSSAVFSYIKNPELLVEFFWRYSLTNDKCRGWDTSVQFASSPQADLFERKVRGWINSVKGRPNLPNYEKTFDCCPTATYRLSARITKRDHTLLVRRPFICASSPFERHTRTYLAYDLEGDRVIFMKDAWRTVYVGDGARMSELEVYPILTSKKIPYTPELLFVADVVDSNKEKQETKALARCNGGKEWLRHYRLAQRMAVPLGAANNSKEFAKALYHAGLSMVAAHDRAGLLHRDISLNNVMINPITGDGILNDWDMCCKVVPPGKEPVGGRTRTGTPAFMSIGVERGWMRGPKIHTLRDDMQSLGWTLVAGVIRYFMNVDETTMRRFVRIVATMERRGKDANGKSRWITNPWYREYMRFESNPLRELVSQFTEKTANRIWDWEVARQMLPLEQRMDDSVFDSYQLPPDVLLSFFEKALRRTDWPVVNDTRLDAVEEDRGGMTMPEGDIQDVQQSLEELGFLRL